MRITRLDPAATARDVRAISSPPPAAAVAQIIDAVRARGDAALAELSERFDGVRPASLRVEASAGGIDPELRAAIETALANVTAVANAALRDPLRVTLPQGQTVEIADVPVRRAGAYVPGGRAAYPSSVVMCAAAARAAGVDQLAVCSPPGPDGRLDPAVLAACSLAGVDEVYAVGGAQAIAALAYGTETIAPVDVVAGPGNAYVTEAKRQVQGSVGIDGLAGPSELVVIATADPDLVALDLIAQAEHGPDSLVVVISPRSDFLDAVIAQVESLVPERPSVKDAPLAAIRVTSAETAIELADSIAPEHLQLIGPEVEPLAHTVRSAGCVFVGRDAATAFGDYVAGSNHVLPTGGAARFESALGPATFRRRMARVSLPPGAAARLAPPGAALARAEGFPVHAESMERRT